MNDGGEQNPIQSTRGSQVLLVSQELKLKLLIFFVPFNFRIMNSQPPLVCDATYGFNYFQLFSKSNLYKKNKMLKGPVV